jgi:CDP-diacylglycerol--glycerol-3-phosphate 3-phosphatidyltransferase
VLKSLFGADSDRIVHRLLPFLARVRIRPDTLTLLGVVLSAGTALVFALGHPFAGAVLILGGIAFGMAAAGAPGGLALALWALAGTVLTSYTRARAERHLARFDVGVMERGERFVVLILGALLGYLTLALWVVAIGATITSAQRLVVARRLLLELERTGVDPTASRAGDEVAAKPAPLTREV